MNRFGKTNKIARFALTLVALAYTPWASAQMQSPAPLNLSSSNETNSDATPALPYSPWASPRADSPTPTPLPAGQNSAASDDDPRTADGWHVAITPFIWFAGVHGSTGAFGHDASVHASFSDIFKYFNIGAMGALEPRYNRIVMPIDFLWMKLSDDKSLPIEDQALSIKAKMTETILTGKVGYRFLDGEKLKADVLIGFRYWHLSNNISLQPTRPLGGFSASDSWVDEIAGMRFGYQFTPKLGIGILGDAGGGGAKLDYQVGGYLGYKLSRSWDLLAGYRYLVVHYQGNGNAQFLYNVAMPGLILGATWSK
jgi:hypothetical protein